jgi:biopolymer transport protein ExbB/TolQ
VIERVIALFFRLKDPSAQTRTNLLEYLSRGDLTGGELYIKKNAEGTSLGRITAIGLQIRNHGGSEEELQARMDEALTSEIARVDRRTGFLAMFGNVATLLGLLGTISGMIHSFAAVASANPADRATMLSKGISEAMNCTAFGLIVAIPALIAYAVFQNRTDRYVTQLTESVTEIYHDLLFLVDNDRPQTGIRVTRGGTVTHPSATA